MGIIQDVEKGDFGAVVDDVEKSVAKLFGSAGDAIPQIELDLATLAEKVKSDAEGVIVSAIQAGAKDVEFGGFTSAAFIAAGKDALAVIVTKGIPLAITDVFALLNIFVGRLQAVATQTSQRAGG